ncbi:MAG: HEAT repeat domain-containing protein, partial [Kofleriaceae bacterium]
MNLRPLARHKVMFVTALPGTRTWIAQGSDDEAAAVAAGTLDDGDPRKLTYGGKKAFTHSVIAMCGLDPTAIAISDGVAMCRLSYAEGARALKVVQRWLLPGDMGWHAHIAASAGGEHIVVASDARLLVAGAHERCIVATDDGDGDRDATQTRKFTSYFRSPAVLPGDELLVVGRGDGRLEVRDLRSLEVRATHHVMREAVLATCALDERTIAIADDNGTTGLLDLQTGTFVELQLGHMKTAAMFRLGDGRLVVVGLSRRITVFEGTQRVREADLSSELGDRYVQDAALVDSTLVLACEQRGLLGLPIDELPVKAAPLELPAPARVIRAQVTGDLELIALSQVISDGTAEVDGPPLVAKLLAHDDETVRRNTFHMFAMRGIAMPRLTEHLTSANPRVRYYAADLYGEIPAVFVGRAAELRSVLADPVDSVVAAAAWSLGRLGDRAAAPWLVELLGHTSSFVRTTAAPALVALGEGVDEIVAAIRAGAGELTFSLMLARWPTLSPALQAPVTEELVAQLAVGLPVATILELAGATATEAFLAAHGAEVEQVTILPRRPVGQVINNLGSARRWAATFEANQLQLTSHA